MALTDVCNPYDNYGWGAAAIYAFSVPRNCPGALIRFYT